MAENDKYVPSEGNAGLDPADPVFSEDPRVLQRHIMFKRLAAEKELFDLENQKQNREFQANKQAGGMGDEYEADADGTLRNRGYWQTKGGQATLRTRAARAHITERTWGKYNRGEAMDMYGNKRPSAKYVNAPKTSTPPKKSDINASASPTYAQLKPKSSTMAGAAGSVAGGLLPWIGRFHPAACGPVLVSLYAASGGVYQSNAQEAINNGLLINSTSHWT
jgi:hypothetical protein